MMVMVIFVACMWSLIRLLSDSFLLFLAAIVPSIALAWLIGHKIAMVPITSLQLINALLELTKVKLQVFIDLTHF